MGHEGSYHHSIIIDFDLIFYFKVVTRLMPAFLATTDTELFPERRRDKYTFVSFSLSPRAERRTKWKERREWKKER